MKKDTPSLSHQRPLSPHLQVYKPQITSILSIMHRLTGVALAVGTIPLVIWLWAAAYDMDALAAIKDFFAGWLGRIMMIGWTIALYYHLANGVRHLFWDMGKGFELGSVNKSGIAVIIFTILATAATWIYVASQGA